MSDIISTEEVFFHLGVLVCPSVCLSDCRWISQKLWMDLIKVCVNEVMGLTNIFWPHFRETRTIFTFSAVARDDEKDKF